MKAVILANGPITNYEAVKVYLEGAYIIACDGGLRHAAALEVVPDYLVGDFDSVSLELLELYMHKGVNVERLPVRKNFTDMELSINFALDKNAEEIYIFGGIGSRLDHTLANVACLLAALKKGVHAELIDEYNRIFLIEREINISAKAGDLISLLPFGGDADGVWTSHLEYPLNGELLRLGSARGVSNVFLKDNAAISLESGILAVILSRDD